ncbi:MAG TPA: deoxyguanosinetriphosphate triphosphohydrolase [Armatimonadota bacterium]|nr:deoxyguanosinetriphosphate triphosphohydrolase [Armatimonadota bacterium]
MSETPAVNIRIQQEDLERRNLSPYAALSAESAGRARAEDKCPIRTDFQRDRDRIVHCKAFRRLKHKTQVFIDPEEDHYRTRLTHTLEVAQIARTIARALRLNEDLTEAISLGHDLGHTPFGHAGEQALDEVYQEYVPEASFRHDEQSLRVVDVLERDGRGLNLTREVREGILHHAKGSEDIVFDGSKPNGTLEGRVVRVADRIAYINHDIDDAVRAGVLSESDLPADCVFALGQGHSERIATMVIDLVKHSRDKPELSMSAEVTDATNRLKDFLFERVYGPSAVGPRVEELRKAARLVKELFRLYVEQPNLLPGCPYSGGETVEENARAACDFIAGMTDRYAMRRYAEHFMPQAWETL